MTDASSLPALEFPSAQEGNNLAYATWLNSQGFPPSSYFYFSMLMIRRFEETVLDEFKHGVFRGTTHTYLGEEANAVGVLSQLQPEDMVVSNHRCHGHFLAYGGDPFRLFAEMMGKKDGVCGGRGGSQHLHWRNFYSNGIQGGGIPIATGMALAEKRKKSGVVAVAFLGDGTFGEGAVYEAFNMAALWGAPILYVVENNHIAQTTPTQLALAGSISARLAAFGIPYVELDSSDVREILPAAQPMLKLVRSEQKPQALILNTERLGPHSKGDDTRSAAFLAKIHQERDPLMIEGARLPDAMRQSIDARVTELIKAAFAQALEREE